MRCISTGVPSNQNQEVLPQYSSQESHSWFKGGYAKRFPPLSHPLPDLMLPPYLPDHVECYPTSITTLPNGLKIASENSLVCRCNFFFFSHGPWILCFQDIFYSTAVSSLINGFSIIQFSVWNSSFLCMFKFNWWQGPAACIGLFVDSGSIYESEQSRGVTHLLERMAFKSTKNRSHLRIIREIEATGSNVAASALREQMCYIYDTLKTYVPEAVELLIDYIRNPVFLESDVKEQVWTFLYVGC